MVFRWFFPRSSKNAIVVKCDSGEGVFFQALVLEVHILIFDLL